MSNILIPKSRIVEAACRTDFLSFFRWCFHVLESGSTLNMNWHHHAMAYHLELVLRGAIKRLIIAAPPRTLKSLMTSVAFPAFMLGRNPAMRVIGISHSSDLAIKFSNDCRVVINDPRYHVFFPRMQLSKNAEAEFHTTQGGYRCARSAEGSLTGIGGGILILDDIQKPMDMASESRRISSANLYYNTVASRTDNQHSGAIVIVGQRLHPDDLIGTLLRSEEKWTVLTLPAIAEKDDHIPIGPGRWHTRRAGDLLDPAQQSREFLEAFRSQNRETFAAQYQQHPIPPGGFMIKREQIQYCDELPRKTPSTVYIQSWDTAQKPGEANARSACLDIIVEGGNYFIARALAGQWEYHDLEQLVLSRADQHKPNVILIEDAGFGTALIGTLNRRRLPVVAVKPEGDKKSRLLREISKFANGQIFLLRSAPGRADLEAELLDFPSGRRNDQVDALSQALAYEYVPHQWTEKALENYGDFLTSFIRSRARF